MELSKSVKIACDLNDECLEVNGNEMLTWNHLTV